MSSHGYCTVEDVRRVLQEADLGQALQADNHQIAVDAITGLSEWLEKATRKHWYVSGGITEDGEGIVPTDVFTRDDEHDIPSHGATVHGASDREHYRFAKNSDALLEAGPRHDRRRRHYDRPKQEIRIAFGRPDALEWPVDENIPAYTRIRLARKDVSAVNTLNVVNESGGFDDWTSGTYTGGVGNANRGDDWWVRENNRGVSELYLNVHAMDDGIASFSSAVYVDIDYGEADLPKGVRRGVAQLAASELITDDEFQTSIPDQGQLVNVETKGQNWERRGLRKLSPHIVEDAPDIDAWLS